MATKRTSLESLKLDKTAKQPNPTGPVEPQSPPRRPAVKQQTAYLPLPVYEQLRRLAFDERAKMHDYIIEGLDLAFKARGLKSIAELTGKQG